MDILNKKTFRGICGLYSAKEEKNGSYIAALSGEKYYITTLSPENTDSVRRMIQMGTPKRLNGSAEDRILWPAEIINEDGLKWCALKIFNPDSFKRCTVSLYDLLSAHIRVAPAVLYRLCANISGIYSLLSMLGFYFNIYSLDDIVFDTKSGEVCIKNAHRLLTATDVKNIKGTPIFMAPETIEGSSGINRFTNIYSCLTYLFCLIYRVHPLHSAQRYYYMENSIEPDNAAIRKIYGSSGEFCFLQSGNAPVEAAEALGWKETDDRVKELFRKLYTTGLKEYKTRATLQNAYDVFSSAAGSFPSASIFSGGLFGTPVKLPKKDDAAERITINNNSMSCSFDLGGCSDIASQLLKINININISITERNGCFYLMNNSCHSFSCRIPGNNQNYIAVSGCEIKLVKGLVIEIPSDNNNTVLKLL